MPPRIHIVADDLTGALDSAAPFAMRGARVRIACTPDALPQVLQSNADVIAVSTGTRDGTAARAAAVAQQVATCLDGQGGLLFKKIDSRLKGHISVELDALAAMDRPVVVNPAIPRLGRFCIDAAVTGAGIETPIPVPERMGRPVLPRDAATQDDLRAILNDAAPDSVLVGAAGLAEALAERHFTGKPQSLAPRSGPALMAIGSRDPVTLAQLDNLRRGCPDVQWLTAPNGQCTADCASAAVTLLQMTPGHVPIDAKVAGDAFSHTVARVLASLSARTLFACGGETAAALMARLDLRQLALLGEVLPGVPVVRDIGGSDLTIVTKSGGFGGPETLVKLVKFLSNR